MALFERAVAVARLLHWRRGLRAGVAVAAAMFVAHRLGQPMGWAALGGFEAVLVDNGGPYRTRLSTIATVLLGGAACGVLGSMALAGPSLPALLTAVLITAVVCFAVTFARVASQPVASTSVIILVIYFAGYGSGQHTLAGALGNVTAYVVGGLWAALLSLFFWPIDPFRPARLEVAACYDLLAAFTATLRTHAPNHVHASHDDDHTQAVSFKRQLRAKLESARAALTVTAARAPARTVRARNLSVLLETADMLFAGTVRLTEFAEAISSGMAQQALGETAAWLSQAEGAIASGLRTRPPDDADSYGPEGSHSLEHITRRAAASLSALSPRRPEFAADPLLVHLRGVERDALQNVEIAFEALRAVWTGIERGPGSRAGSQAAFNLGPEASPGQSRSGTKLDGADSSAEPDWLAALRENWSLDSVMMRHALRMAVVGAADVLLLRAIHVSHGFWLAMTSIIVLQPYSSGTLRKSAERVGGTVAGGIVAALLAAVIHSYTGVMVVITLGSVLTLATYAVDYGWYSFFLTPTFVLLSLPYLHDWRYAGARIVTTMLGAATAVLAMRLLWPQSLRLELANLLARSVSAASAYVRGTLQFWALPETAKVAAERQLLAPARRACGLTSQDAEEALDRTLLEPNTALLGGSGPNAQTQAQTEAALTFTTYIRRFTQCLTALATAGTPTASTLARMDRIRRRLDALSAQLVRPPEASLPPGPNASAKEGPIENDCAPSESEPALDPAGDLSEQMLQRMERQAGVLERAASVLSGAETT